jgi:hypothetical protein
MVTFLRNLSSAGQPWWVAQQLSVNAGTVTPTDGCHGQANTGALQLSERVLTVMPYLASWSHQRVPDTAHIELLLAHGLCVWNTARASAIAVCN